MLTNISTKYKKSIHLITSALIFLLCGFAKTSIAQDGYVGEIKIVAEDFVPQNWLPCDGRLIPIQQNTALFSILGTTYGGDGITNFALPNLKGKFPMGADPNELGDSAGSTTVTLTNPNLPLHRHPMYVSDTKSNSSDPTNNVIASPQTADLLPVSMPYTSKAPNATLNNSSTTPSTSANEPINIMPPSQTVNYIICANGGFPIRP